jgi:hypothetical protein
LRGQNSVMATTTQAAVSPDLAGGLAQLSQIIGNLRNLKAAGKVMVPVIAQALALMPNARIDTTTGRFYRASHTCGPSDIWIGTPSVGWVPLMSHGQDTHWAIFGEDLPELVDKLLANPHVQALADGKLERIAHVLDD